MNPNEIMNQTFYMVYLENGDSPTHRHSTFEGAEREAKRLCKITNKKAYVLCSLKSIEIYEFREVDLRPDNELPF
jgi:hypothetical protein